MHHVCDEHEWTGGKCGHGELEEHNLPWFDRRDKDFEALQKVILDAQLLEFPSTIHVWAKILDDVAFLLIT